MPELVVSLDCFHGEVSAWHRCCCGAEEVVNDRKDWTVQVLFCSGKKSVPAQLTLDCIVERSVLYQA